MSYRYQQMDTELGLDRFSVKCLEQIKQYLSNVFYKSVNLFLVHLKQKQSIMLFTMHSFWLLLQQK